MASLQCHECLEDTLGRVEGDLRLGSSGAETFPIVCSCIISSQKCHGVVPWPCSVRFSVDFPVGCIVHHAMCFDPRRSLHADPPCVRFVLSCPALTRSWRRCRETGS